MLFCHFLLINNIDIVFTKKSNQNLVVLSGMKTLIDRVNEERISLERMNIKVHIQKKSFNLRFKKL